MDEDGMLPVPVRVAHDSLISELNEINAGELEALPSELRIVRDKLKNVARSVMQARDAVASDSGRGPMEWFFFGPDFCSDGEDGWKAVEVARKALKVDDPYPWASEDEPTGQDTKAPKQSPIVLDADGDNVPPMPVNRVPTADDGAGSPSFTPPTTAGRKVQKPPKATVNARMLDTLQKNPECRGWTVTQWTKHLHCSRAAVSDTQTWRELSGARKVAQADRALSKRRRPKHKPH